MLEFVNITNRTKLKDSVVAELNLSSSYLLNHDSLRINHCYANKTKQQEQQLNTHKNYLSDKCRALVWKYWQIGTTSLRSLSVISTS